MATITSIPSLVFSSVIPQMEITLAGDKCEVIITCGTSTVYDEILYPVGGVVHLDDLDSLLNPFLLAPLSALVTVSAKDIQSSTGSVLSTVNSSFTAIYCECDTGVDASTFTTNHFLSILMGSKQTAAGRLEYLHAYASSAATAASVTAYYADESHSAFAITGQANGNIIRLDVSPNQFAAAGKDLVYYIVTMGNRTQRFDVLFSSPDVAPILLFTNSFGVQELFYCTGTHEIDPTYERSSALISGMKRNYHISETRTFKADTGILTPVMADWADELFRSREIYVCNYYTTATGIAVGKELTITDSKSSRKNDDDDLPSFTFSYVYAQRIHNVLQLGRAGRIFDNTFDNTFE